MTKKTKEKNFSSSERKPREKKSFLADKSQSVSSEEHLAEKELNEETKSDSLTKSKISPELKKRNRRVLLFAIFLLLIIILGGLVTLGVGLYRYDWNNHYINQIIKVIPYPVSLVNFRIIRYSDFRSDVETLKFFYQRQKELSPEEAPSFSIEQINKTVLDRLIEDEFVSQIAAKKNLKVTPEEIDEEFKLIVDQAGSLETVQKALQDLYQWNSDQFKSKVLSKFILRRKLEKEFPNDPAVDTKVRSRAEEVLAKVKAGEKSFEELAKEFSEDITASQGGDLGYLEKGKTVPEFENVAFSLEVGKVSDLVKTEFGYHIIKVDEKIPASGDNGKEAIRARHILIKYPTISQWLEEELNKAKVFRFVKT